MMRTALLASTALLGALLALPPAPASAQELETTDPAGDAANPGLDFTLVRLDSRDQKIVVTARFAKLRRGTAIVSVDPRGLPGLRLVSTYQGQGASKDRIRPYAFSDPRQERTEVDTTCPGFRVTWKPEQRAVRMVLPSRCLNGGGYGAVRYSYLSERGADTDFGPQDEQGYLGVTDWIPRG